VADGRVAKVGFITACTLLAAVLASTPVMAQVQLARIEGTVLDAAGGAAPGAVVTITDPLGAELRRVVADARGRFVVAEIMPGRYALRALSGGAVSWPVPVTVQDALPVEVVVRLPPAFSDALAVEGRRVQASVATRASIGGDSISRLPVRARSHGLQDVVATMPGWATEDNGLLHSRGVDDGFLYVVDGVPVYERLDQLSGIAPDTGTIDAVNVVTGFVPPEFGYKAGGVIEVRTRSAESAWRGSYELGAGSDAAIDSSAAAGGAIGSAVTLWLGAAGQRSDRHLDPVHPDNFHNRGGMGKLTGQIDASPTGRDRILAAWGIGRARYDVPNTELQDEEGQDQRQRIGQGFLTASWQRTWSAATVTQAAVYHRRSDARLDASPLDTPITTDADRSLTRTGALAAVTHQAGRHLFKAGGEIQTLDLSETFGFAVTDEDDAEEAGLSEAALAFDLDNPFSFAGRARPTLASAYVQDSWQASSRLTIAAGLRFDLSRLLLPRHQWSPRLGMAYTLDPSTTIRASASRFFQPPQPENLLLSSSEEARALSPFGGDEGEGGAEVEPERQWAYEAGLERRLGRGVRLDAAYWRRSVREVADPNVFFGSTIIFPNAVAEGRAQGFDVRLEVAPRGSWSGYANWSIARTTQTGPITGGLFLEDDVADIGPGTEFVPDHDQRYVASGGVTWTGAGRLTLSGVARYESGTPIEVDEDELDELVTRPGAELVDFEAGRVEPRTVVSAMANVRLWQAARYAVHLRAAALNVFNQRYAYNFGNPFSGTHFGAPRTLAIAVRIEAR
jgi:outer membrane receptor protein involved in Fe transport